MSTKLVSYATYFAGSHSMQFGWLWANITGRSRWHLVHTFEGEDEITMVRFVGMDPHDRDADFEDVAEGHDGRHFVPLRPPGHVASYECVKLPNRRVDVYWGDGSVSAYEWRSGEAGRSETLAMRAIEAVQRAAERAGDD